MQYRPYKNVDEMWRAWHPDSMNHTGSGRCPICREISIKLDLFCTAHFKAFYDQTDKTSNPLDWVNHILGYTVPECIYPKLLSAEEMYEMLRAEDG